MSSTTFNIGDTVSHKTTDKFDMVIIGNCQYRSPTMEQMSKQELDPNRFHCRYYNPDTKNWEEGCFQDVELVLSTDG